MNYEQLLKLSTYSKNLLEIFSIEEERGEVCELCNETNEIKGYCDNGQCNKPVCEECPGYNNEGGDFFCCKECSEEVCSICNENKNEDDIQSCPNCREGMCVDCMSGNKCAELEINTVTGETIFFCHSSCVEHYKVRNYGNSDEDYIYENNIKSPERYPTHSSVY